MGILQKPLCFYLNTTIVILKLAEIMQDNLQGAYLNTTIVILKHIIKCNIGCQRGNLNTTIVILKQRKDLNRVTYLQI